MTYVLLDFPRIHAGQKENSDVGPPQAMRRKYNDFSIYYDGIVSNNILNRPGG